MADVGTSTARDRGLYYGSKLAAQAGQNLLWAALFVGASAGHNAALGLSSLFLAQLAPSLLFGMPGGALADRLGPARGMLLGAALRFAVVAGGLLLVTGATSAWLIAGLYSTVSQVFTPAEMAMVRELRRDSASQVHALLVALQYGGQGIGMLVLAPALYFAGGPQLMLLAAAGIFLAQLPIVGLLGWRMRGTSACATQPAHDAYRFGDTCRFFVRETRARYAVAVLALKVVVARGIVVALPLYLKHDLGLGNEALAYLLAPGVVGVCIGLLWCGRGMNPGRADRAMRAAVAGMIVAVFALAVLDYGLQAVVDLASVEPFAGLQASMNTTFVVALPAAFLLGIALSTALVSARAVLSETAPRGQQARVFAAQQTLTETLLLLPLMLTGIGAEVAGARMTLAAIGILALIAVAALELPRLRGFSVFDSRFSIRYRAARRA